MMTKPRPTVAVAMLLAALMLLATGCTGSETPGPVRELVWAAGGITEDSATYVADAWNRQHPQGPRVRVEALPQSADDQHQLLALELNAGIDHFDILDLDAIWTAEFAEEGWLLDLDDMRSEIEEVTLPGPVETAVWDDILWAAPFTTDAGLLYYRTDLVSEPPTSWQELVDDGSRIGSEQGIAPFVADGAPYEGLVVQYLEYLWAFGGDLIIDGTDVTFDETRATDAAEFMRTSYRTGLYAPGFETMTLEDARDTFQSGQAVFLRSWPYAYRPMNDQDPTSQVAGKVGIAPLPTFDGSGSVAALGGHNLAVSRFSSDVSAAQEFVRFATTSRDVQRRLAEEYSLAPTLRAAYDDLAADPLMALLDRVLPTARPRPATPEWAAISEEIQQQVLAAYTGDVEPAAAVAALRRSVRATVQRR